ncbi:hypothetical protein DFH29DRAFT_906093 [Suillus ampliporus]|nr:hypothetical protein DFH29DRAFT_906093 [Suillus ampliporus]
MSRVLLVSGMGGLIYIPPVAGVRDRGVEERFDVTIIVQSVLGVHTCFFKICSLIFLNACYIPRCSADQ